MSDDEVPSTPPVHAKKKKPRMTRKEVEYARSRKKFVSRLSLSPTAMLLSIEASKLRTGGVNRGTQYERFADGCQTDMSVFNSSLVSSGFQTQVKEATTSRFPSLIHFLKAASSTVSALLDQSQFSGATTESAVLSRTSKFTTETIPIQVAVTASRTYALMMDPAPLGRIAVWTAVSRGVAYHLVSSSLPSCFTLFRDGRYVVAGTESGTIVVWDLLKTEKTVQQGVALILQPVCATDKQGNRNHRQTITSVSVFERSGAAVVAALDATSNASFWYVRNETTDFSLVKAEEVQIAAGSTPSYAMTMVPNSVNAFVVGCSGRIFNCCRFRSPTSPAVYGTGGAVKSIAFSPIMTNIFAAAGDDGRVRIYDVAEAAPSIELCVNMSLGETQVIWSPTRASVLFVSDVAGMRVHVYDLFASVRVPVHVHKVGSAAQSLSIAETTSGVVLAVAEGGLAVMVHRVSDEYSRPLSDDELGQFKIRMLSLSP